MIFTLLCMTLFIEILRAIKLVERSDSVAVAFPGFWGRQKFIPVLVMV